MSGKPALIIFCFILLFTSCKSRTGEVCFTFSFAVEGEVLQQDTLSYVNAAGNVYSVSEVQYFISNVILVQDDGTQWLLQEGEPHYVDADIASTLTWEPGDAIPEGNYEQVILTFGLDSTQNQSYRYTNPPENNMSWPANLGGGYHYMKINGWWLDEEGTRCPFNLHTGRLEEQDYTFSIVIPLQNRHLSGNTLNTIPLVMDINRWFDTPTLYNFNTFGGSIMQNATAQEILQANGHNTLTLGDE